MTPRAAIALGLFLAGLAWGWGASLRNQNPYHPEPGSFTVAPERQAAAWHWRPSPLWLPSWLLCTVPRHDFGISRTRSGYLFRTEANRRLYHRAGTLVGGLFGGIAAGLLLAWPRRRVPGVHPAPSSAT